LNALACNFDLGKQVNDCDIPTYETNDVIYVNHNYLVIYSSFALPIISSFPKT